MPKLRCILGFMQLAQAFFGVVEKDLQQMQVAIVHDLLQVAEYLAIDVVISHLLTP
ncbi:hypothetical protein D1872_346240 [compost metagenome]